MVGKFVVFSLSLLGGISFSIASQVPVASRRPASPTCLGFYQVDPILGLPRTAEDRAYVQRQNNRSQSVFDSLDPALVKRIRDRGAELAPKNAPARSNFYGDDYGVKDGSLHLFKTDGTAEVFIAGSVLPKDATFGPIRISPDRTKIAFSYSKFGSDWQTWQIYDLESKQVLERDGRFTFKAFGGSGVSWTPDSKNILLPKDVGIEKDFIGLRTPSIVLHTVGQSQQSDRIVFSDKEPTQTARWNSVAIDLDHILVYRVQGVATIPMAAYSVNIKTGKRRRVLEPNKFLGGSPGNGLVGVYNGKAYFRSAQVGNNFGIVSVDVAAKNINSASKTIVGNDPSSVLYQASIVGDKIVTQNTNTDLTIEYRMYELDGTLITKWKPSEDGLPKWGNPGFPMMDADGSSHAGRFTYSSVELPTLTVRADVKLKRFVREQNTAEVPFDSKAIVKKLVYYKSEDGKEIPMFIYQRADSVGTPAKFAYLYSYGFIGIPNLPVWNRKFQLALELGGIVAIPAIRGGGEFGVESQLAGTEKRSNTFQDLVFASRWLKENMDIEGKRVAVVGRSFGGLTGAVHFVHNQKEFDLISSIVPVTDWNRHFAGSGWWMSDDFGVGRNPISGYASKNSIEKLKTEVRQWNPLDHLDKLEDQSLIPTIFFSQQFDTNTTPHQTFDFVKVVQDRFPNQPVYMYEHPNGGHSSRSEFVEEMLFIAAKFGLTEFRPLK